MARELMWVCAVAPEEFRKAVYDVCISENREVGLSENVFKLPLHISLKKSFYTEAFDEVRADIYRFMSGVGCFWCYIEGVTIIRNMVWLSFYDDGSLHDIHTEIDRLLETKYGIPIDRYDRVFCPHISLFTRGTPEQMQNMYERLKKHSFGKRIEISRFVTGSSGHKDRYYNMEG